MIPTIDTGPMWEAAAGSTWQVFSGVGVYGLRFAAVALGLGLLVSAVVALLRFNR